MKTGPLVVLGPALVPVVVFAQAKPGKWIQMFDGKNTGGSGCEPHRLGTWWHRLPKPETEQGLRRLIEHETPERI